MTFACNMNAYVLLPCSPISRALFDYLPTEAEQRAGNLSFYEGDIVEVCIHSQHMSCLPIVCTCSVPCVSGMCTPKYTVLYVCVCVCVCVLHHCMQVHTEL